MKGSREEGGKKVGSEERKGGRDEGKKGGRRK